MPLWGASDSDESKPKNLTTAQKKQVFANASGWVLEAGSALSGNDNTDADPEVLVAIGDLSTSIGAADITEVEMVTTTADKSEGFTISVRVRYNEPVNVVTTGGTPTLAVTNGNEGSGTGRGPHSLSYASGSGTNELIFSLAIAAANAPVEEAPAEEVEATEETAEAAEATEEVVAEAEEATAEESAE